MAFGKPAPQCGGPFISPVLAGSTAAATVMLLIKTGESLAALYRGDVPQAKAHSAIALLFGSGALYGLMQICPPSTLFPNPEL